MTESLSDGSSVFIKAAQYTVNKSLEELDSKNPQLKIGDWKYLQALPQYGVYEHEPKSESTQLGDDSLRLVQDKDEPPKLPPIIPTHPGDSDHISWNDLHQRVKEAIFDGKPSVPSEEPKFPPGKLIFPPWYCVAIIGAGVAGLRTAMLLQRLGIPYKIFEASGRPGGRVFTYQFSQDENDYYDVGPMRFPKNDANKRTFDLFDELGLTRDGKVVDYIFSTDENIRSYNNITRRAVEASGAGDPFNDGPFVPKKYLDKRYTDPWGKEHFGVDACTAEAFDPFRKALIDNFPNGWEELMKYDWASTRSYLTREKPAYPLSVVHWMETRDSGTGDYDQAFSEHILESLGFDDPTKDVEWKRLKGGSEVLIDAMLEQLINKPTYGQHVTSIEQVYMRPLDCFPDLTRSCPRRWRPWLHYPFSFMSVRVSGQLPEYFTHVVSAVSFANLGTINTDSVLMSYKQRHAIRSVASDPAVKVGIKFKTRWWEMNSINQRGGSSHTDMQSRVVVYPSYGIGDTGTGVLMVAYNWNQDASRYGALIKNPDWSEKLDPDRIRPKSEQALLDQIYGDLAALHGVTEKFLRDQTLDYHAFYWYANSYTMGAFTHFAPGDFSTFFADIVQPAGRGRFHFAGELASHSPSWVAGALDSAVRVVNEILLWDFPSWFPQFKLEKSLVFSDEEKAEKLFVRGLFSKELDEAGL